LLNFLISGEDEALNGEGGNKIFVKWHLLSALKCTSG
jgi:hypothetical protein